MSPAGLQALPSKRVAGGTRIEFDRDDGGYVLMTEDPAVISGFRQQIARGSRRAAQLQYSLACCSARSLAGASRRLASLGINTKEPGPSRRGCECRAPRCEFTRRCRQF